MTEEQFGSCPECGKSDGYRNIYSQHFFFCDEHRITWSVGTSLFSSWRVESPEDWRAAWEELKDYRVVDLDVPGQIGPTLGEVTSFEAMVPPGAPPTEERRPGEGRWNADGFWEWGSNLDAQEGDASPRLERKPEEQKLLECPVDGCGETFGRIDRVEVFAGESASIGFLCKQGHRWYMLIDERGGELVYTVRAVRGWRLLPE